MAEIPTLFVCHGETAARASTRVAASRKRSAPGIEYEKVIAGHGSPIPFLRKGSRDELRAETGTTKLPTIKFPTGR